MRCAGILQPVSALPSKFGVGDFGPNSFEFIDAIVKMGFKIWQVLPLNPLGYGNSPYQPYSSYAGDPIYISIEALVKDGLLNTNDFTSFNENATSVDFSSSRNYKNKLLRKAYKNYLKLDSHFELELFLDNNKWVISYGTFITFKEVNNLRCWNQWPVEMRDYPLDNSLVDIKKYQHDINYHIFTQFLFFKQWLKIKEYAGMKNIEIMGDIPIYVSIDSLDVWLNRELFLLDSDYAPTFVAGVPPDYFSKTGQRWGNPIYNWEKLEETDFSFWVERIKSTTSLFDILRVDHFRAFDTYYQIPQSCPTAVDGQWLEAPGYKLFDKLFSSIPEMNLVVEDLGELRPQVLELRDNYNLKGMKILQFTFDPTENNNDFEDKENMIIYTGTHDNDTICGWYNAQSEDVKASQLDFFKLENFHSELYSHAMIEYIFNSIAEYAIVPTQDILSLDSKSRTNTPGTIGSPNWEWKLNSFGNLERNGKIMKSLIQNANR